MIPIAAVPRQQRHVDVERHQPTQRYLRRRERFNDANERHLLAPL